MAGRHLLYYNDSYVYIPIGPAIVFVVWLFYGFYKCAQDKHGATAEQDRTNEPGDIEVQATTPSSSESDDHISYPQSAFSTTYSSGVVHVPAAPTFDGYSPVRNPFTRAQIEAMSLDELKILKEKLNME
jgi:hypothetical protein